jgi:hypothetical protein
MDAKVDVKVGMGRRVFLVVIIVVVVIAIAVGIAWLAGAFKTESGSGSGSDTPATPNVVDSTNVVLTDLDNLKVDPGYTVGGALNGVKKWNPQVAQAVYRLHVDFGGTHTMNGIEIVGGEDDGTKGDDHDISKADVYDGITLLGTFVPKTNTKFTLSTPFTGTGVDLLLYPNSQWQIYLQKVAFLK